MANGLARAYSFSFFVRPMQRLCYRSNWFQEILFRCLALFHVVHSIVSPLHSSLQLFLSSLLFQSERMEDTKRLENHRIIGSEGGGKEERNIEGGRGKRKVERRTSNSTFHKISIFFRYFLSPFIPSVSYHAASAPSSPHRASRGILSYRLPSDYIRQI